jgi:hypothetical protein
MYVTNDNRNSQLLNWRVEITALHDKNTTLFLPITKFILKNSACHHRALLPFAAVDMTYSISHLITIPSNYLHGIASFLRS